jgi:uncharacterized protein DUF4157/AID/APOBEC-like deaminase family protein
MSTRALPAAQRADRHAMDEHNSEPRRPVDTPAPSYDGRCPMPLPGLALAAGLPLARSSAGDPHDPLGGAAIPPEVLSALRRRSGGGQPLPARISEPIGAELGHDLSSVRVHADAEADSIARSVQSVAFTYGTDVYFTAGSYRPHDTGGQHLLAHELAHVAQSGASQQPGTVGRADDPAETAADRTADRVIGALRRRASTAPAPEVSQPAAGGVDALRRQAARVTGSSTLRRAIAWQAKSHNVYARNRSGLLGRLTEQFPTVEQDVITTRIDEIVKLKAKWTPSQAYQGIKNWIIQNYAPAPAVYGGKTGIKADEARNYFVSNFKTFAEVVIDGTFAFKFTNLTEEDLHAEDSFMAAIDKFIVKKGWHEDFSESHSILLRINNSPCTRCAGRLYDWDFRDIFDEFDIQFANMYEKGDNFHKATTQLRSGGITMSLYSVTANLQHLLKEDELAQRKPKDNREALDFAQWLKKNEPVSVGAAAGSVGVAASSGGDSPVVGEDVEMGGD